MLLIQARVTSDILDVLRLQRLNLSCSVGLAEMPSANLTSRPLRQVTYGLLLGHILDLDLDLDEHIKVKERDREGLELRFTLVKPTFTTSRLQLSSLNQVTLCSGTSQNFSKTLVWCSVKNKRWRIWPPDCTTTCLCDCVLLFPRWSTPCVCRYSWRLWG